MSALIAQWSLSPVGIMPVWGFLLTSRLTSCCLPRHMNGMNNLIMRLFQTLQLLFVQMTQIQIVKWIFTWKLIMLQFPPSLRIIKYGKSAYWATGCSFIFIVPIGKRTGFLIFLCREKMTTSFFLECEIVPLQPCSNLHAETLALMHPCSKLTLKCRNRCTSTRARPQSAECRGAVKGYSTRLRSL